MEIHLSYHRTHFEEIFKANHEGSYTRSTITQSAFHYLIFALFVVIGFFFLPAIHPDLNLFTLIILLGVSFFAINYGIKLFRQHKKRKNINIYLDRMDSIASFKLILTDDTFCVWLGDDEVCESWENFVRREDLDLCVYLVSHKETYFIPKKSMVKDDWRQLISFLDKKITATIIEG